MLKNFRRNYVIKQVEKINLPEFCKDETVRMGITFSGRVQKVGFRLEVEQLAKRLNLTGNIKNLENGDVKLEIQGEKNKILFLVDFMNNLIRIKIRSMKKEDLPLVEGENDFIIC